MVLHRRQFLLALGGAVACATSRLAPAGPAGGEAGARSATGGADGRNLWLQPIWNGFGPHIETTRPLLEVFHSARAWRHFIEPLWPDPEGVVKLAGFDWSEWVLLLAVAESMGGMESKLGLREVTRQADGKVILALDSELDPKATAGLDVEMQMSMLAKGSRKVFRPDTPVEFEIEGRKGTVTHY
jgi:hypothetical protein